MTQPNNQPKLVVFAGPNGSGKSTITPGFQQTPDFPVNYINPDEIALTLSEEDPTRKTYQATAIAEEQRTSFINNRQSFAFETVMSHPSKLEVMKQAKDAGYQVELVFIATSDPEINVNRVRQRVEEGGHDVPADKIRERYKRTIELLPAAAEIADRVRIYDNSSFPVQAVIVENGAVTFQSAEIPEWVQNTIQKLEERFLDRTAIIENTQLAVLKANIDTGKYTGQVNRVTDNYIVQQVDSSTLVLHDRSIVKREFAPNQNIRIAYNDGNIAATLQPTTENQQWAESILPTAIAILSQARQSNQVTTTSRGIEVVEGSKYKLQVNSNNETLSIISKSDNREVAAYDLAERTVIAANPTSGDIQNWQSYKELFQINPQANLLEIEF